MGKQIRVERGSITDLASIPSVLGWWQAPHEATMAPGIVHDFLYWDQPCTKDEADAVMYVAMKDAGVSDFTANRVCHGIRTKIAHEAWKKNKVARESGEQRFFSSAYVEKLMAGQINSKATLSSIQAEATRDKGWVQPTLAVESIKAACDSALREFTRRRDA